GKWISAFVAKTISGLPYQKSTIARTEKVYKSQNDKKGLKLNVEYNIGNILTSKTQLDKWLTERYCLYLDKSNGIHRYDIHHKEWELKHVNINHLNLDYKIGEFNVSERAP